MNITFILVEPIPVKAVYPSLNLAQAVMIYAYELQELISSVC